MFLRAVLACRRSLIECSGGASRGNAFHVRSVLRCAAGVVARIQREHLISLVVIELVISPEKLRRARRECQSIQPFASLWTVQSRASRESVTLPTVGSAPRLRRRR